YIGMARAFFTRPAASAGVRALHGGPPLTTALAGFDNPACTLIPGDLGLLEAQATLQAKDATRRLRICRIAGIVKSNQEVAHGRSHRKAHRTQGTGCTGLARAHGSSRVRAVVSRQARRALPAGPGVARPDHLSRLRTREMA